MTQTASAHAAEVDKVRHDCAQACLECQNACEECAGDCLASPEMMELMHECVRRALDCGELCALCATLLARKSDLYVAVGALCAAACERCAEECRAHDHPSCQRCGTAADRCAAACRLMLQAVAARTA